LYPVLVQGENSAPSIVEAIRYFNQTKGADVLIVGRGGGSIEDLWSFNEESVARAIYHSEIPIISAVGHEIDFTISDFVADLRAPTPSAAAELVVPSQIELKEKFNNVYSRLYSQANRIVERASLRLKQQTEHPLMRNPLSKLDEQRMYLDRLSQEFSDGCVGVLEENRRKLQMSATKLDGLSPLGVLTRGFSVAKNQAGGVVKSVADTKVGELLDLTVADGVIQATVTALNERKAESHG